MYILHIVYIYIIVFIWSLVVYNQRVSRKARVVRMMLRPLLGANGKKPGFFF